MLLIQEIFGVGPYIRAVGERLAAAGYVVGAPDLSGASRPASRAATTRPVSPSRCNRPATSIRRRRVSDCVAALGHLATLSGPPARPGVIGFCLGGTLAFGLAAAGDPSVCISYYGSGVPGMIDRIARRLAARRCSTSVPTTRTSRPMASRRSPPRSRRAMVLNVEAAGHAFDNHEADMFWNEAAAKAAWSKTMAFLAEHHPA